MAHDPQRHAGRDSPVTLDLAYDRPATASAPTITVAGAGPDRSPIVADAREAGFSILEELSVEELAEDGSHADALFFVAPALAGEAGERLSRIDRAAARDDQRLLVEVPVAELETAFLLACETHATMLAEPKPYERLFALTRLRVRMTGPRVNEVDEERALLVRLTEQIERLTMHLDEGAYARLGVRSPDEEFAGERRRGYRPPLPDAGFVRAVIANRQRRAEFFDASLFADPAWDILLDLTAARVERKRVSITSLCLASGVPPTTGLRWIAQMTEAGLLRREEDETDRRRAFVALTDEAELAMARYFEAARKHGLAVV